MLEKIKIVLSFLVAAVMLTATVIVFGEKEKSEIMFSGGSNITDKPVEAVQKEKTILVNYGDNISETDLEEYIIGVVAGEVYPTYSVEALKAQAVAARTYLVYKMEHGGCANGGDICTESAHCQAYKTNEKMRSQWGDNYEEYYRNIKEAVYATKGEIIKYDNKPICALYHSSSVGQTEDCVAVFGGTYPYLQSVSTSISTENKEYSNEISFTKADFLSKVNAAFGLNLEDISIRIISYTASGRVSTLKLGEKSVKATSLRKALGLRSTDFTFEKTENGITFTMKGYGHGVGMSQVGAEEMAKNGSDYKAILTHYYTGTIVEKI